MLDAAIATRNPATQLAHDGPLFAVTRALRARLEAVFPPARFQHGVLPLAPTRDEWQSLVKRTPYIGITWIDAPPSPASARLLQLRASWRVVLVTANMNPAARLIGDKAAPGQLGLVQVAAAALHGWTIGGGAVPGAGTMEVTGIASLSTDGFADAAQAVAGITVSVPFMLFDANALDDLLRLRGDWQFVLPDSAAVAGGFDIPQPGSSRLDEFILDIDRMG